MNSQVNRIAPGVIAPVQRRGRQMHEKLVAATLRLLEERSFETLSVAEITREAGVATGSFYRRFKSKEALLPLLYQEYDVRYAAWSVSLEKMPAFGDRALAARLRALVETTYMFFMRNAGLLRALHLNSRIDPAIVPDASYRKRRFHYQSVAALINPAAPADRKTRQAANAVMLVLISTLSEQLLYPSQTPAHATALSKKQAIDALTCASEAIAETAVRAAP